MNIKPILQREEPVLREVAQEVPVAEITSSKIQKIITEMKKSLVSQDDGVAIAAPQIGYSVRIFVVSGRFIKTRNKVQVEVTPDMVFINPVITKLSKEKKDMEEGCLSVRYLYGKVSRSQKATVIAYNEHGKKFMKGGSGLMAQVFQHETDHLNGVLFIDTATHLEEVIPQDVKKQEESVLKNKK